jgi:hypothetical protein
MLLRTVAIHHVVQPSHPTGIDPLRDAPRLYWLFTEESG